MKTVYDENKQKKNLKKVSKNIFLFNLKWNKVNFFLHPRELERTLWLEFNLPFFPLAIKLDITEEKKMNIFLTYEKKPKVYSQTHKSLKTICRDDTDVNTLQT